MTSPQHPGLEKVPVFTECIYEGVNEWTINQTNKCRLMSFQEEGTTRRKTQKWDSPPSGGTKIKITVAGVWGTARYVRLCTELASHRIVRATHVGGAFHIPALQVGRPGRFRASRGPPAWRWQR